MSESPPIPMPPLPRPELYPAPEAVKSAVSELQSACGPWTPARSVNGSEYSMQTGVCDVVLGRHDAEYAALGAGIWVGIIGAAVAAIAYRGLFHLIQIRVKDRYDRVTAYFSCIMLGVLIGLGLSLAFYLTSMDTYAGGIPNLTLWCILASIGSLFALRAMIDRTTRA